MAVLDSFRVNGTDYDLRDSKAVRFDEVQTLTDAQKQAARQNIGAVDDSNSVHVNDTQSLTEEQKARARANIGVSSVGMAEMQIAHSTTIEFDYDAKTVHIPSGCNVKYNGKLYRLQDTTLDLTPALLHEACDIYVSGASIFAVQYTVSPDDPEARLIGYVYRKMLFINGVPEKNIVFMSDTEQSPETSNVTAYSGTRVSIIGDSISTYNQTGYKIDNAYPFYPANNVNIRVLDTWWMKVIKASGAILDVNASVGGSKASNVNTDKPDFYARCNMLGNPDLIFVQLGTNDSGSSVPLGDYDYTTAYASLSEATFRTAYIKGVKALQANYPSAKIVLVITAMGDDYADSIRSIGKTLDLQTIDARDYAKIDAIHPNAQGMRDIASKVLFPVTGMDEEDVNQIVNQEKIGRLNAQRGIINVDTSDTAYPGSTGLNGARYNVFTNALKAGHSYALRFSSTSWTYPSGLTTSNWIFAIDAGFESKAMAGSYTWTTLYVVRYPGPIPECIMLTIPDGAEVAQIYFRHAADVDFQLHIQYEEIERPDYCGYDPIGTITLAGSIMAQKQLLWAEGVEGSALTPIVGAKSVYNGSTAQGDIKCLTYEDGSPIIENNKIWFSMSTSYGVGAAGGVIYECDLGTSAIRMTGCIRGYYWKNGTRQGLFPTTGNGIMYNRQTGMWTLLTRANSSVGANPTLVIGKCVSDPRFGVTDVNYIDLDYDTPESTDEDASIFWAEELEKWVLFHTAIRGSSYILKLYTSDYPDHGFTFYKQNNSSAMFATGPVMFKVGGVRYIGTGGKTGESQRYKVWKFDDLSYVGALNFDYPDNSSGGFCAVIPVPIGDYTKYIMLDCDRSISNPFNQWSYGNMYLYEAFERNPGREYPIQRGNVTLEANITATYGLTDLHFRRQWAKRYMLEQEIPLGEIDLTQDVLQESSNVYPQIGTSLALTQNEFGLFMPSDGSVMVLGGEHQTCAVYVLSPDNICVDDVRFIAVLDRSGNVKMKVGVDHNRTVYNYDGATRTALGKMHPHARRLIICTGWTSVLVYDR